jgi:hypothetical protein
MTDMPLRQLSAVQNNDVKICVIVQHIFHENLLVFVVPLVVKVESLTVTPLYHDFKRKEKHMTNWR